MRAFVTTAAVLLTQFLCAQDAGYFIEKLKDNTDQQVFTRLALNDSLNNIDTIALGRVLDEMVKGTKGLSAKMKTRVLALRARLLFYRLGPGDSVYAAAMKEALYRANELDERFMIAEYGRWYSEMLNSLGKIDHAVQYALNSIVLQQQLGLNLFPTVNTFYFTIGELFLRTRNYDDAIIWLNKGLALPGRDSVLPVNYANALCNLAFAYHYSKDYKNSLDSYEHCMAYCHQHQIDDWYYVAYYSRLNPFIELGYYDSSKQILTELLGLGVQQNNYHTAAGACFMFGEIANREKDYAGALNWLRKAEGYNDKLGAAGDGVQIDREMSTAYSGLKQYDKSLVYYKQYQRSNDSIDKAIAIDKSDYLMAKANFEKEQLDFRTLRTKRSNDIRLRNIGIAVLAFFSIVIIWWLNKKRSRARKDQQLSEKQLLLFAENIINKDRQIELLRNELQLQSSNAEKAIKVEELSQQMILTEDDWVHFQSLFNKTYPGYLHRLKEKVAGITEAEIRMACLIHIKLNTKQIASMQGISPDSVHKTRHRLRQRFSTTSTTELESILATV